MAEINTHDMTIGFGKHNGERYPRIPCSYLWWMVNNQIQEHEVARAELDRRGMSEPPEVDVSGHAIDGASIRCRRGWHEDKSDKEGIFSWLTRIAAETLRDGRDLGNDKFLHERTHLVLVFDLSLAWPVLVTVYPANKKQKEVK